MPASGGVIWAVWHYPGILFADYHSQAPLWYAIICFTVMAIALSVVMAWICLKSGSVWTAMFFHASYNVFVQAIFTPLTVDTGPTEYFITEFGAAMAVVYAIVGYVVWRRRGGGSRFRGSLPIECFINDVIGPRSPLSRVHRSGC